MRLFEDEMLQGLFVNPKKVECSIHESGKMFYKALKNSDVYTLEYLEIDRDNRTISDAYDFFIFNYHHYAMDWLDPESIKDLPGFKATFVLEMVPDNPFVLMPCNIFDAYCVVDPTMNISNKNVFAFPRPLEEYLGDGIPSLQPIPVIGTFGFATKGKGFHKVVDAVNKEFDEAVVRINIPLGAYAGKAQREFNQQLTQLCYDTAKDGIYVSVTHDYMTKQHLIEWCANNTLNCFLYDREIPGLSATTDQAIASGRPLAVGTSSTFRHIHEYMIPYPFRSLKESIESSSVEVYWMQKLWTPDNFARRFEKVLMQFNVHKRGYSRKSIILKTKSHLALLQSSLEEKMRYTRGFQHILQAIKPDATAGIMYWAKAFPIECEDEGDVLIVNHTIPTCGVHQYGMDTYEALKRSKKYIFKYCECTDRAELERAISIIKPKVIIYNYYPSGFFGWLSPSVTRGKVHVPQLGLMHEVTQQDADDATNDMFDYHICPDPTLVENNPIALKILRLIPTYKNRVPEPDVLTIGGFGFGFVDKGFGRIIKHVQNEFNEATIRFNMPPAGVADPSGKLRRATIKQCMKQLGNSDIKLEISDTFLTKQNLFDFLAGNTVNAFMYDGYKYRGIASSIECALAVPRPLAINKCRMFRHVFNTEPSICIEDTGLTEIIKNGTKPLEPFYKAWSPERFVARYEQIIDMVLS